MEAREGRPPSTNRQIGNARGTLPCIRCISTNFRGQSWGKAERDPASELILCSNALRQERRPPRIGI